MRYFLSLLCLLALVNSSFAQRTRKRPKDEPKEVAEPKPDLKPGVHAGQKCIDTEYTYDLYLPKAYATDKEALFPGLFLSGPGGRPGGEFKRLQDWADDEGVILVTLNESKNGLPHEGDNNVYKKIQRSVVESVKKQCRLHPYLRFSMGASGAAWASVHLALQYPKHWAGVVLLIHSGNGLFAPEGVAVSFLAGEKDGVHPVSAVWKAYHKTKANGNPVRIKTYPDKGHGGIPAEDYKKELSWMLNLMKLAHPRITSAERKAMRPLVEERIANLASIEDINERIVEVESLLNVPWIKSLKSYSTVLRQWFDIKFEKIETIEPATKRWLAMKQLADHKDASKFGSTRRGKLSAAIRKLDRDKDVIKENNAQKKLSSVIRKDDSYRKRKKLGYKETMKLQKDYKYVIEKYPGTMAAEEANRRIEMLPRWKVR